MADPNAWNKTEAAREWRKAHKERLRREAGKPTRAEYFAQRAAAKAARAEARAAERTARAAERETRVLHDSHVRKWDRIAESKEQRLSLDKARALLSYDPMTGEFRWASSHGNVVAGSPAGNQVASGYMVVGLAGEKYRAHRLAWFITHGAWPAGTIDHINGDRADNRLANLRDVPHAINMQNIRKPTAANKSGVLGVYWSERRQGWMAAISVDGKKKDAGPFKTMERAVAARQRLKDRWHADCPDGPSPHSGPVQMST